MRVVRMLRLELLGIPLLAACAAGEAGPVADSESDLLARAEQIDGRSLPPHTLSFTYDDGPDARTLDLARYLADEGIHATFFANGCRLSGAPAPRFPGLCTGPKRDPAILAEVVRLGHRVADHTFDHPSLAGISKADFFAELTLNQTQLAPFLGDGFRFFRPPANYWDATLSGWARAPSAPAVIRELTGPFIRDVDGADWGCAQEGMSTDACARRYLAAVDSIPSRSGIVQMHDHNEFSPGTDYALQVTRQLVQLLRQRPERYTFAPLDAIRGIRGRTSFGKPLAWSPAFGDGAGWATQRSRYGSLRLGDVNGDGKADLCGRDAQGVVCALSTGSALAAPTRWLASDFRDDTGWAADEHGTTLQLGDVNGDGKADLCGRGTAGLICYLSNGTTAFAGSPVRSSAFADVDGWAADVSYYGSIRLADVNGDGKADACGRNENGVVCALSSGSGFAPPTSWLAADFTDALGWRADKHGSTLQLADLNGDGRADICGRGTAGMQCALSKAGASGFGPPTVWSSPHAFSDREGWDVPSRFRSIHLGDIDGDKRADVCGRDDSGVLCALSDGAGHFVGQRYVANEDFRLDSGWSPEPYGSTLMLGDLDGDGRADACARGAGQVMCIVAPH